MQNPARKPLVAIGCGGTGGHLFPGQAVAHELLGRGCDVLLLISRKEVDRQAVRAEPGLGVATLPAVGFARSRPLAFAVGFARSFLLARRLFRERPPRAVLAMGGFASAPPTVAGRLAGAAAFLHESNTVPGRANRWLARLTHTAFVGFAEAAPRLPAGRVEVCGTPVRPGFQPGSPASARAALGLSPGRPVLLVTGGSQGARAINDLVLRALPLLQEALPELQCLHLTGLDDFERIRAAYQARGMRAVVRPFLTEMELALDAATVAVSRAGGSSLAEMAAMRTPALLIPFPFAADDHQFLNARAFVERGAARMLTQHQATPELLVRMVAELIADESKRQSMKAALGQWHRPDVAVRIADCLLKAAGIFAASEAAAGVHPASTAPSRNLSRAPLSP